MPRTNEQNQEYEVKSILNHASYRNVESCKRDILAALHHYRGLQPKSQKYTFNDGRSRDLICLEGTIPVPYRGASYNIPISIFVLDTHPNHAPICYVRPTAEMQIKVSENVDRNGKVYMPYLHEWSASQSDLLGLIQICIITFSDRPPVFASRTPQPPAPQQPPVQQFGYGAGSQPPPYPPTAGSTPYPPVPPTNTPYPPGGTAAYPPYATPNVGSTPYPPAYPPATSTGYPPYPQGANQTTRVEENNSGTITSEHIKASLRSAVEDKVRRALADEYQTKQVEVASLCRIKEELNNSQNKLKSSLVQLDKDNTELNELCTSLKEEHNSLVKTLEKVDTTNAEEDDDWCSKKGTSGRIDQAIYTVAPLHKQIVDAYAEELALGDAIYYLGEALRRGIVDCDAFLKHVRNLSRKQFFLRATIQKAREKAGLPI